MTARDKAKLSALVARLAYEFANPKRMSTHIGRGDARAILAAARDWGIEAAEAAPAPLLEQAAEAQQ